MTSQGGYIEQKTIGISIGTSGTFINTEIVDGKIQLVKKSVNPDIYATNGEWISSVVNIGDNFESYGKLLVKEVESNNSSISVFTRTSSDGINFNEWTKISEENDILSVKNKFIMVKLELLVGFEADLMTVLPGEDMVDGQYIVEDVSGNIKLNRNYTDDMTSDNTWSENGSLHRRLITRSDWLRLDKLSIPPTVGQIDKTLILNQGEYKKWNEKVEKSEIIRNPIMTSNNIPVPYLVSASSIYSSSYEPYKMINLSLGSGNYWISKSGKFVDEWVLMDFGQPTNLTSIGLSHLSSGELSAMPKEVTLSASNDNINFIHLSSLTNQSNWQTNEIRELTFERSSFRYYKLTMTGNGTRTYVSVSKLYFIDEIIGRPSHWSIISTAIPTSQQFLSEGMDSLLPLLDRRVEELEPLPMADKSDILTENGKVFSKTLDLKKYMNVLSMKVEVM